MCGVSESHSEASDQEHEWEEQQIRKGVSIPAQPVSRLLFSCNRFRATFLNTYSVADTTLSWRVKILLVVYLGE